MPAHGNLPVEIVVDQDQDDADEGIAGLQRPQGGPGVRAGGLRPLPPDAAAGGLHLIDDAPNPRYEARALAG